MRIFLLPPFATLACLIAMSALNWQLPITTLIPSPLNWPGLVVVLLGLGLAQWHARLFKRLGTNIQTFEEPGELTTEGLFRRSRNPMYLGMLAMLVGAAWSFGTLSPWIGPVAFFALAQAWYVPIEEQALHAKFGDSYARYQAEVPRWL